MPYNRLLARSASRYSTRRRPNTRIQGIRNSHYAIENQLFARPLSQASNMRRVNALRNTASGMISRFMRNPQRARIGSRYR